MRLAFAGTPHFGALVLGALLHSRHEVVLVVTQPDRPAGRGRQLRESPVKQLALREGLRIAQPERASTPEFLEEMRVLGVEVFTVAAFGQILREPLLGGLPCINAHASLLPKYRGAAPIERAIMAGEKTTGVSIMDITPKVDTGAVYLQHLVPIEDDDDAGSMYEKLGRAGGEALAEVLDAIEAGGMKPEPQDENAATYVEKITTADREIDWNRPATEIAAQVRGLSPHIGAFTLEGGRWLKIWQVRVEEQESEAAAETVPPEFAIAEADRNRPEPEVGDIVPGKVTVNSERLLIACGIGNLELIEVQTEGKRRMSAAEFLRGHGNIVQDSLLGA